LQESLGLFSSCMDHPVASHQVTAVTAGGDGPGYVKDRSSEGDVVSSSTLVSSEDPRVVKEGRSKLTRPRFRSLPIWAVSVTALGSGIINLLSVLDPWVAGGHPFLRELFPVEFLRLSRFLVLLIGFALIASSLNLYRRKRRAWQFAMALAVLSFIFNLTKALDYPEALLSLALAGVLWLTRKQFWVKSSRPDLKWAVVRLGVAAAVALAYGIWGFWILDPKDFGINFTIGDAIRQTLQFFTLVSPPEITPHTRHAVWFFHSMYMIVIAAYTYAGLALFRPVTYAYHTAPREHALAVEIAGRYGRSSLDYFKLWRDKSYLFSPARDCFIAYKVAGNFAIALGDPVGPPEQIPAMIRAFASHCKENDWRVAFHQATPETLRAYRQAGFHRLKIGDDAIVDLDKFRLEAKAMKTMRSRVQQLEKLGVTFRILEPPLDETVLQEARDVSDEWLQIPGRRERSFTLGAFEPDYLRKTRLAAAFDAQGKMLAFVNFIPSYARGECTLDLMRRRTDSPNGIMDYLFVRVIEWAKTQGYQTFCLGMAPMSGFQEREEASLEERAVHNFFSHLNFIFSYQGLRSYKGKFATRWEPRYEIYRNALDLPRLALAIAKASEYKG
jgi:phosphatidylglycerol lysyltransferase